MTFEEALAPTLAIRCADDRVAVPGAQLKRIELDLWSHGFAGEVTFWVRADAAGEALHTRLTGEAPIELELAVAKARYREAPAPPLRVRGAVTARAWLELTADDVIGAPVIYRRYRLGFVDPARAAWSTHRPTLVHANESVADLVQAQRVGDLRCEVAWPELARKRPLVCLGLGEDDASFHDFVAWIADRNGGHFFLDYEEQVYHLAERKRPLAARAPLLREVVESLELRAVEPIRHQLRVLNSWAGADAVTAVELPGALPPLAHDVLVHTPVPGELKAVADREARRRPRGRDEAEVVFRRYPELALHPGAGVGLDEETFSAKRSGFGAPMRVTAVRLVAEALATTAEADLDLAATTYRIALRASLEHEDDPRPRGPPYRTPRYPIQVEGRITSAVGDEGDRAYTVYEDERTSQDRYRVLLPTWNATIEVPFTPLFQPGHLYFPAYRDARVLVTIDLDRARLAGFLDWGRSVRLPLASQGNHILFGRNATSETSLRHWYVESRPELQLRRAHAGDLGVIAVKQGTIVLEASEDEASAGAASTESVRPEAESARASAEAKADVATSELQGAVLEASGRLDGEVSEANAAVRGQAESLRTEVRAEVEATRASLRGVTDGAEAQGARARGAVADARQRLSRLVDGEE